MGPRMAEGQAEQAAARIAIVVGHVQPSQRRDEGDPARVSDACRQRAERFVGLDQAQVLAQPANRRAGNRRVGFETIGRSIIEQPGQIDLDRIERGRFGADVDVDERTRAMRGLGLAALPAVVPEQRTLLIADQSPHRDRASVHDQRAEFRDGRQRPRQRPDRDVEPVEPGRPVFLRMVVPQTHRLRQRDVGDVPGRFAHRLHQPVCRQPDPEPVALSGLTNPGVMHHPPLEMQRSAVGPRPVAESVARIRGQGVVAERVLERLRAQILPCDRVRERQPGLRVPDEIGVALRGDPDRGDVARTEPAVVQGKRQRLADGQGHLPRVLLDLARTRVNPRQRPIAVAAGTPLTIQHQGPAPAGALIDPNHIVRHTPFRYSTSRAVGGSARGMDPFSPPDVTAG